MARFLSLMLQVSFFAILNLSQTARVFSEMLQVPFFRVPSFFLKKTNFSTQTRFHPTWAHSFKVPQRRPFSTLAILTQFGKVRAFTDLGHFLLYSNICPNMIRMSNYQNLSYFWLSDDASLFHLQASLSVLEPSALVCLNHAGRVSLLYRWINAFLPNTQVHLDV